MEKKPQKDILRKGLSSLQSLYSKIPETTGCIENIDTCRGWCCLTPEVRVYTPTGLKPISLIQKNDYVYTKNGLKKVLVVGKRHIKEDIVVVESCYKRSMRLTADHLVLADNFCRKQREKAKEPQWIRADSLIPKSNAKNSFGNYLIFPKIKQLPIFTSRLDLFNYDYNNISKLWFIDNDSGRIYNSSCRRGSFLPRYIEYDDLFCWFLGIYLSEGSLCEAYVEIHSNISETGIISKIMRFAKKYGLNCTTKIERKGGKGIAIRVFSSVLVKLIKNICGIHCDKKKINEVVFGHILSNIGSIRAIHRGLYDGDGTKKLTHKLKYSYVSTSKELIYQIEMINNILGEFPSLHISKKKDNKKQSYILNISNGKYKDYVETNEDFRIPIRGIHMEAYDGDVFDIEIEDSDSFFTECGEVHNCKIQTPQVLYVEFLNTWDTIMRTWDLEDVLKIVEDSVMCYISTETTKGCVFFDQEKYTCKQHKTRCFNCRIYGITPKEEFEPRYLAMKEILKKYPNAILHNQCDLVSTKDGTPISVGQTDIWWKKLTNAENFIGIERDRINDGKSGSYRTYHDHILLYLLPNDILQMLTNLKTSEIRPEDRRECVKSFMQCLKGMISSLLENHKKHNVSPEENTNS